MKKLILLAIPIFIFGQDLRSLIEDARSNNDLVISKTLAKNARSKNVESKKSAYLPVIDIGAYYQSVQDKTLTQAGDIYSGYAKIGYDIYDGGKRSSLLEEAKYEYMSALHDEKEKKKSLGLEITKDFYAIKNLQASMRAKKDAGTSLGEQLERIKKYYEAGLATKDDIDRLQAAYDTNVYETESLKLDIFSSFRSLELKVGKRVNKLDDSSFKEVMNEDLQPNDAVKSLIAKQNALIESAESIQSAYYPQIRVEDTYSVYGYDRADTLHPKGLDDQNKIFLSANMRLYDFGALSQAKQVLVINSQAIKSEVSYRLKEQKMNQETAKERIRTYKVKIKSALSALVSAKNAFKTINEKYNAGIVDYVIYLNALTSRTDAQALYEASLNELQNAYATYYYYNGKDLTEYIK